MSESVPCPSHLLPLGFVVLQVSRSLRVSLHGFSMIVVALVGQLDLVAASSFVPFASLWAYGFCQDPHLQC